VFNRISSDYEKGTKRAVLKRLLDLFRQRPPQTPEEIEARTAALKEKENLDTQLTGGYGVPPGRNAGAWKPGNDGT
jgi:hypothetical protein